MPNALAGEDSANGYIYTVLSSIKAVQLFYETEMGKVGWNVFATGQGESGALIIMFMKGTDVFTVSILAQEGGLTLVILVK